MATLAAVVDQLKEQNENLSFVRDALESEAKARISAYRREEAARKRAIENKREADAQKAKDATQAPQGFRAGVIQGLGEATGFTGLRNLLGPIVGAVFGTLFGGVSIAALKGQIGKMVGRGLIFGPAILLLETFGSEIVQSLLTEMSDQFNISLTEEQKKSIANTAINALDTGLLLSIFFGKKGFKAGIIGSLLSDTIKYITGQPDSFWTSKVDFAGIETPFTNEALLTAGSLVAAYFGPSLLYGAIFQGLGGKPAFAGAYVGRDKKGRFTKLKPTLATTFRTGFISRLAPALILATVGNAMADYMRNEFGETTGDVASWTMNGVAVGSLFGPQGAILGGLAGLAIAGAEALGDYLRSKDQEIRNKVLAEAAPAIDKALEGGELTEDEQKAIARAQAELRRAANPVGGLIGYAGDRSMLDQLFQANIASYMGDQDLRRVFKERISYAMALGNFEEAIRSAADYLRVRGDEVNVANIQEELIGAAGRSAQYGGLKQSEIYAKFGKLFNRRGTLTTNPQLLDDILKNVTPVVAQPRGGADAGYFQELGRTGYSGTMGPSWMGPSTNVNGSFNTDARSYTSPFVVESGYAIDHGDAILGYFRR